MPIEKSPFDFFGYMLRGEHNNNTHKKKYRRRKNERVPLFSHVPSDRVVVFFFFWTLEISYKVIFFFFYVSPLFSCVACVVHTFYCVCCIRQRRWLPDIENSIDIFYSDGIQEIEIDFNSFIFYYIIDKKGENL